MILISDPPMFPFIVFRCAMAVKNDHVVTEGGIVIHLILGWDIQSFDYLACILVRDHNFFT